MPKLKNIIINGCKIHIKNEEPYKKLATYNVIRSMINMLHRKSEYCYGSFLLSLQKNYLQSNTIIGNISYRRITSLSGQMF
jgi:hypothetical protein